MTPLLPLLVCALAAAARAVPEDCGLPKERGSCDQFAVRYYFDTEYGGCLRFWYGGCDGNGNRFATESECERSCVSPPGDDLCRLPAVRGACKRSKTRWFSDPASGGCRQFTYSGCLGNDNRFESESACKQRCGGVTPDSGRGGSGSAISGGVRPSDAAPSPADCLLPEREAGDCRQYVIRYTYIAARQQCAPFYYGGCGGNNNRFDTAEACQAACVKPPTTRPPYFVPDRSPSSPRDGRPDYRGEGLPRPAYGREEDRSPYGREEGRYPYGREEDRSPYGREDGRYPYGREEDRSPYTREEDGYPYGRGEDRSPYGREEDRSPYGREEDSSPYGREEDRLPYGREEDRSPYGRGEDRSPYDREEDRSPYGREEDRSPYGREEDRSPYGREEDRSQYGREEERAIYGGRERPQPTQAPRQPARTPPEYDIPAVEPDVCSLPAAPGRCRAYNPRFYFNAGLQRCVRFIYGGCDGNGNRFTTLAECEARCGGAPRPAVQPTVPRPAVQPTVPPEPTSAPEMPETEVPDAYITLSGVETPNVCQLPPTAGSCDQRLQRYYFNAPLGLCFAFTYSGCGGNLNRFQSRAECQASCQPGEPVVTFAPFLNIDNDLGGADAAAEATTLQDEFATYDYNADYGIGAISNDTSTPGYEYDDDADWYDWYAE